MRILDKCKILWYTYLGHSGKTSYTERGEKQEAGTMWKNNAMPKPTDKKVQKEIDKAVKKLTSRYGPLTDENKAEYQKYLEALARRRANQYRLEREERIAAERERIAQRQREMSLEEIEEVIGLLEEEIESTEAALESAERLYLENSPLVHGALLLKAQKLSGQEESGADEPEGGDEDA